MTPILTPATLTAFISMVILSASTIAQDQIDFNRDIRPLLSSNCLTCHGPDEAERVNQLRLDTEAGSRVDLGGYAAIVPGKPQESEILQRLTTDDVDLRMPPPGKGRPLSSEQIDLIRRWIQQGAAYARHWSYEKPVRPAIPQVKQADWAQNPIDHFILARLEALGMMPSPQADRWTLARRVSLDLTGLPPTWDEANQFAGDQRENAYELYVDRLLAKDSFGERWARVWLDLARYADSAGYADDPPRTIWAYRDYVIRSLNQNKPFDQFTIEQIAGDLLPNPTDQQLVATAFHRNTMTNNEGGTNDEEFRNVAVVDRVNTTMAVWMGTTMACAQCHTHKFDPITQEEYFQFFAFFNNTSDADHRDERPIVDLYSDDQKLAQQRLETEIQQLRQTLDTPTPELARAQAKWLDALNTPPLWFPLVPNDARSQNRPLKVDNDGWIHARGERPETEKYTITYPTRDGMLTALKIDVPKIQVENFVLSQVKATWRPDDQDRINARFVRIDLPGEGKFIHLAEIEVYCDGVNVAAEATVKQSSTAFGGEAKRAIDGNTDGDFANHSVTHTAGESDPWIEVDLGSEKRIEKVVLWNRVDGGKPISDRILGMQLSLLDADHQRVWQQTSTEFSQASQTHLPSGPQDLQLVHAAADFSQTGFSAMSVLASQSDPDKQSDPENGWAIAPQTGQPHELTLTPGEPLELRDGELTVQLMHQSKHKRLPLDHFRISFTDDPHVLQWSQIPADVRRIVQMAPSERSHDEGQQLAAHYRSISELLDETRRLLSEAEKQLAEIKPTTTVPVMQQVAQSDRRTTKVQLRGNYQTTGSEVSEGTPVAFHPLPTDIPPNRLALARWLVDPENPLTSRVTVNRHWEEIFGIGIVETSEEFGSQGELPSHPLLLDWLAVELRDGGWDIKALLKLLVTSATYRQSSVVHATQLQADPENRWYSRGPRFRISAEMVRDQAMFVSGLLSQKMYGPPVRPPQPQLGLSAAFGSTTDWKTSDGQDRYRRGIYTTWRRSSPYPSMAQFDAPNREVCTVRRIRTNTPLQALVTLNDPVYVEAAQSLARKMIRLADTPTERIEYAIRTCLIRDPTNAESDRLSLLVSEAEKRFQANPDQAIQMATEPLGSLPDGVNPDEYAAWTVVANVILNLDEMFMKR